MKNVQPLYGLNSGLQEAALGLSQAIDNHQVGQAVAAMGELIEIAGKMAIYLADDDDTAIEVLQSKIAAWPKVKAPEKATAKKGVVDLDKKK